MHLVSRDFVCGRLKMSRWASYGIVPATSIHLVPSDVVISVLNESRRSREPEVDYIPSDIITAEEAEEETGIPCRKLLMWTRREVKSPPHYRFNKQTTRFRRSSLNAWLERRTNG